MGESSGGVQAQLHCAPADPLLDPLGGPHPPHPRLSSPRMTRVPDAKVTFFFQLGPRALRGPQGVRGRGGGGEGGLGVGCQTGRHLAADARQGYVWSASHSSIAVW